MGGINYKIQSRKVVTENQLSVLLIYHYYFPKWVLCLLGPVLVVTFFKLVTSHDKNIESDINWSQNQLVMGWS
jgi:hypothetical protein